MANQFTDEDDALLNELGVVVEQKKVAARTPREERIIAAFKEIQRFVETHGRTPHHGEDRDMFERIHAVRLDRIREQEECHALVAPMDDQHLLKTPTEDDAISPDIMDDDALLAELGIEPEAPDITELRHVRSSAEKRAADEIGTRSKCEDFEKFRPLFEQIQRELDTGIRETRPFGIQSDIEPGRFFIVGGQKAFVAKMGREFRQRYDQIDARLRVIFDNGTESNMLRRSLHRALRRDETGRRILDTSAGPLFSDWTAEGDEASGTIYVLRSQSDNPYVSEHRDLIHKIGVTNAKVETRIGNARLDPTFLMAEVEIVAEYKLYNIDRGKLEKLMHRIFAPARLNVEIEDRFGNPVVPREWFLVPLDAIDTAVGKIRDGTIAEYVYDEKRAVLVARQ